MESLIVDEKSFKSTAMAFYDNRQCNSIEEFEEDLAKILLIKSHFCRYDAHNDTNFRLLINHFISFTNCFGIISETLLKYKIPKIHYPKLDSLFVFIGYKSIKDTNIDENFVSTLKKSIQE